jgi:hypothetical protein
VPKIKTDADNDSVVAVFHLRNTMEPDFEAHSERVIVCQSRDLYSLYITLPDGAEIVVYGPPCGGETQIFLHPESDELRESPDAIIAGQRLMGRAVASPTVSVE